MLQFPLPHEKILPSDIKIVRPSSKPNNPEVLDRIKGSLVGLAVGDALGASVEFRPRQYLLEHPVHDMKSGGTWGLDAGQWTDDTSMALCLASSLISRNDFDPYDQMVRYKWWHKHGYLSSTGQCFDIGNATRASIEEFYRRQNELKRKYKIHTDLEVDQLSPELLKKEKFDVYCSRQGVAGNGALMRLAPVPLFFYQVPPLAVELSGRSGRLTHGDDVAIDACRYYGALIVAAVRGESKEKLLDEYFYDDHQVWFGTYPLHETIVNIARGSFKKRRGYDDGIRGKGHIVWTLEAALWAFWSTESFDAGALAAVNLGDDTDTTAAIYGQLAGAFYGYQNISPKWRSILYARDLITCIAEWTEYLSYSENKIAGHERIARSRISSVDRSQQQGRINLVQPNESGSANNNKSKPPAKPDNHSKPKSKRGKSEQRPKAHRKFHLLCVGALPIDD
ncbi:unnamed protein product [Adineta steineri]|uniref:ADP-ribosylglycohydrolase n=1 Tax=Adineta steineri TaxID=433720 RepID=A0A814SF69_9BILA|nr:unnamed protein product [Adineta steineri]CAF1318384.1 unnamed protein product [Adineta steineri]